MPDCKDCANLITNGRGAVCKAFAEAQEELKRPLPPPPLGACVIPIVEHYIANIKPGDAVLEIGCGSWSKLRDACVRVGAMYEGIDPSTSYFGEPTVATRCENLANLSFANETFDWVIGNQTMEHWAEFGCSLSWGLWQCFRVLKPEGTLCLNVPIFFHGTAPFLLGELNVIKDVFAPFSSTVRLESWGEDSRPLDAYIAHPLYKPLAKKTAYVLNIYAKKDRPLPASARKKKFKGRLGRWLEYPLTYNVYRWKNRLRSITRQPDADLT